MKPNMDLRFYAKGHGVAIWQIAQAQSIHENTLLMRLRKEFPDEEKAAFRAIVDRLAQEGK
ncbi:MAG: hypothetical protein WC455_22270 [Dehalococcoidia bacterium]|jgi:hypothetical protein